MLNPSNMKFKLKANFSFENIKETIKVRNLLKKYKYKVSSIIEPQSTYAHRERRLKFIVNNLIGRSDPITMSKFFSTSYVKNFNASYATYARDIAILILQGKIKASVIILEYQNDIILEYQND